jgi:7-cyano-7-deazaguanine synthase
LALKSPLESAPASEWWPFRTQFLVTIAAMRAIAFGIDRLLVGSVKSDSFHVDGKSEFYERIDALLAMQEGNMRVQVPAIHLTSVELVQASGIKPSLLGWTHSCHKAEYSCGFCRGCSKRLLVMSKLGYGYDQAS